MSNLIELVFSMSVISSMMFGVSLVIESIYQTKYVEYVYFIMKVVLIIYAVPIFIMIYLIVMNSMKYTTSNIFGEDMMKVRYVHSYNIDQLPQKQIIKILFGIWILGVAFFSFNSFVKGKRLLRQLVCNSEEITSNEVWNILEQLRLELGIRKSPKMYKSYIVNAPFLTGVLNPVIIFPNKQFSVEEWEMMLRHELMHLKGKDLIFKALVGGVQSVHWFNPVVYFYKKIFFDFCEYACDRRTTVFFNNEQRSQYARLIVSLSALEPEYEQVATLVDTNYKVIERRIREIMRVPKKEKSALLIGTLMVFMTVSPMVTYAAVTGIMRGQSEIIRNEVYGGIEENSAIGKMTAINEKLDKNAGIKTLLATPRGVNNIDLYVPATGACIFDTMSFKAGQKVSFSLASDKSSDSFSISIANSAGKGKRYSSSNGVVAGTYTIPSSGDYDIYIDGYNYGGDDIHVTGMIRIE